MNKHTLVHISIAFALVCILVSILYFIKYDRQITGFFRIGDVLPVTPFLSKSSIYINEGEVGYDGQQFLTIALDPALNNSESIRALDNPRYRYRRIMYPLLGYFIGFGKPIIVSYALVGINIFCIVSLVFLSSIFMMREKEATKKQKWLLPFLTLAITGIWVSLFLSTADLLGTTLFLGGLVILKQDKNAIAALCFGLACLTRETYLAVIIIFIIFNLLESRWKSLLYNSAAIIPSLFWNIFVIINLSGGTTGIRENIGLPFVGVIEKIQSIILGGFFGKKLFESFCFFTLLAAAFLIIVSSFHNWNKNKTIYLSAFPFIALLILSKMQILNYHVNYLRVFVDIFMLNLLTSHESTFSIHKITLLSICGVGSLAYATNYIL